MTTTLHTQLETRSIDTLIPYARNSRTHSDEQVAQVAASIKEFGFTNPVLIDETGGIIAGHGRVLADCAVDALRAQVVAAQGEDRGGGDGEGNGEDMAIEAVIARFYAMHGAAEG